MSYVFLLILLLPVKIIARLFRKNTGKNLVIQTAKIGDFINATPLLAYLQKSDVLISRSVSALASHDETIESAFFIEQQKQNLWRKLCFACHIMNRYDNVYLLQPTSSNLFFAAICNANNKQFLSIYTRRWYHGIFYTTADGTVNHEKRTLSVTNYLRLADRSLSWQDSPKHATKPLFKPSLYPGILDKPDVIRIGISISAGNKAKTIPPVIWKTLFDGLASLPCTFYVFGASDEQPWMDDITREYGEIPNIVNMIGKSSLEALPWAIAKMDCYIASDSGNIYIADAVGVPVVLLFGPCCHYEQRPLGNVLLIGNDEYISSYVFETRYYFNQQREELFAVSEEDVASIKRFITELPKAKSLLNTADMQGNSLI
ncbi:ADP-heptose:LPS heptosyltransferase [Enterobacter sp. AG5470]|nr:ADP-heptose:LPS heptosyltransferase [Enterobacter sp. AG5470]